MTVLCSCCSKLFSDLLIAVALAAACVSYSLKHRLITKQREKFRSSPTQIPPNERPPVTHSSFAFTSCPFCLCLRCTSLSHSGSFVQIDAPEIVSIFIFLERGI